MLTLAADTTADFGSIALADENGVREEVGLFAPQGFSNVLYGEIEAMFARQRLALTDIELYAGLSGPGSFTGIRVGLAAIKGLAEVLGRKAVAISTLEAIASFGSGATRAVTIDAKRGEVFAALFDSAGQQIIHQVVIPLPRFLEILSARPAEWISTDSAQLHELLAGTRFEGDPVVEAPRALAGRLAQIAIERAAKGMAQDPGEIDANYVRRSDAELFWKGG